jgi:small conductance mechanosensitive channel
LRNEKNNLTSWLPIKIIYFKHENQLPSDLLTIYTLIMKKSISLLLQKYGLNELVEWVDLIFIVLEVSIVILVAWLIIRIIRKIISGVEQRVSNRATGDDVKRIQTLSRVLRYIATVIIVVLTIMSVLSGFGVSVAPFLATAGVAGIAVGFGAQSLVKDYFTGFVMLIEDQIRQGDIVEIAGKIGTVEEVTLRYIRLRDYEGVVHFVPNSVITVVTNRTRSYAYSVIDINVSYKESVAHVNEVLKQVASEMRQDPSIKDNILGDLEIAGLENFADSSLTIRSRIMVVAQYQGPIRREFQARIKLAFERENIQIPYPHVVLDNLPKTLG